MRIKVLGAAMANLDPVVDGGGKKLLIYTDEDQLRHGSNTNQQK